MGGLKFAFYVEINNCCEINAVSGPRRLAAGWTFVFQDYHLYLRLLHLCAESLNMRCSLLPDDPLSSPPAAPLLAVFAGRTRSSPHAASNPTWPRLWRWFSLFRSCVCAGRVWECSRCFTYVGNKNFD